MKLSFKLFLTALCFTIGTAVYAQGVTPGDRAFVAKVSQGGMFEVVAGHLAVDKGSAEDIRDFGETEVHDHTMVGDRLKRLAEQYSIAFPPGLNPEFSAKLQRLSALSGRTFDQAYLAEIGRLHDIDGAAFGNEANSGGTPALRAFAAETYRIVQRHIGAIHAPVQ
jgi:putative membrane protein